MLTNSRQNKQTKKHVSHSSGGEGPISRCRYRVGNFLPHHNFAESVRRCEGTGGDLGLEPRECRGGWAVLLSHTNSLLGGFNPPYSVLRVESSWPNQLLKVPHPKTKNWPKRGFWDPGMISVRWNPDIHFHYRGLLFCSSQNTNLVP